MTKAIRIENADNSNHKVRVTSQTKNADGEWVDSGDSVQIDHPTAMTTLTVWKGRRLIVEEVE